MGEVLSTPRERHCFRKDIDDFLFLVEGDRCSWGDMDTSLQTSLRYICEAILYDLPQFKTAISNLMLLQLRLVERVAFCHALGSSSLVEG